MKRVTIALIAAAQALNWARPAAAAEFGGADDAASVQRGAFAGARLRVPLGAGADKPRAGLALAGVERSRSTGRSRMAAGLEAGFAPGEGVRLAIGGQSLDRLAVRRRAGVSTLGWVAIGVGATAVVAVVGYGLWLNHELGEPHD